MLVSEFPRVEAFRRELRARLLVGHHNNAIEGIDPSLETVALCAMFLQERAPLPVSEPFVDRFFRE